MKGHWYIRMECAGETVEFAVPARIPSISAADLARACLPGWQCTDITWRFDFGDRALPSNAQPTYP